MKHTAQKKTKIIKIIHSKNYITLADLQLKLKEGVSMQELKNLEMYWTASNISVRDHIEFLDAIRALEFKDGKAKIVAEAYA